MTNFLLALTFSVIVLFRSDALLLPLRSTTTIFRHVSQIKSAMHRFHMVLHDGGNSEQTLQSAIDFLQNGQNTANDSELSDVDVEFSDIYDDSARFDVPYKKIAEIEEREAFRLLANKVPSAEEVHKEDIKAAVQRWKKHENDVGSAEVQIAIAHERIRYLTAHLLKNKKDFAAKRGLQALVVARRKFLDYLSRTDSDKARLVADELGIRFRVSGQEWDRETRYGAFKNTKSRQAKAEVGTK